MSDAQYWSKTYSLLTRSVLNLIYQHLSEIVKFSWRSKKETTPRKIQYKNYICFFLDFINVYKFVIAFLDFQQN